MTAGPSSTNVETESHSTLALIVRARSRKQRTQRAMPGDPMASSSVPDSQLAAPRLSKEDQNVADRSSRGSGGSVPSMVDDQGSDTSVEDDQYYATSGEQIWDTFWQSGCEEDGDEDQPRAMSPTYQYPALVTPSLSTDTQQFLANRKRPTQTQSLGVMEAPAYADSRSADYVQTRSARRRGVHACRVSYSIFPPQDSSEMTRQRTIKARRRPSQLTLHVAKPRVSDVESPRHSLRSSASARNLRSGSGSSAFSANSSFSSTSTDFSEASDHTAITTPTDSPRVSWDCPRTPKPTHVSQCMVSPKTATKQPRLSNLHSAVKQPSLPNLRALPTRYRPTQPHSATVGDFAAGEALNARVVGAIASAEPYPRPLFAPPTVAPLHPSRRAPLPPVSQRLPPPVSATRPVPPPLNLTRPLPPLPLSLSRPQTPLSAPPRPQRFGHPHRDSGPTLSPPRPAGPHRATTQPLPGQDDFKPPVVSVFEWDSEPDSDYEEAGTSSKNNHNNPSSRSFARRIARGFAHIQASRNNNNNNHHSNKDGGDELTRIRSGEPVTRFRSQRPARQRAVTVEDVRRVEEDIDGKLRLAREQVARERNSYEAAVPHKVLKREKSALFGRMLGWKTQ